MEVWGDKIIMELNDAAKNGDVETAWDSSEVGADAEIEYVPLMRVENSSSTNMGGMHIIQNIPPSFGEGAFVDESLLAVKLTILWVVFCLSVALVSRGVRFLLQRAAPRCPARLSESAK